MKRGARLPDKSLRALCSALPGGGRSRPGHLGQDAPTQTGIPGSVFVLCFSKSRFRTTYSNVGRLPRLDLGVASRRGCCLLACRHEVKPHWQVIMLSSWAVSHRMQSFGSAHRQLSRQAR
ncbi:hypothetical protein LY76DRAFT_30992 [Colletotrichum caudatum]|nr:hypothetical protein LY76DRAFT_30992 [Colletotrichum caudatum]